MDVDKDNDDPKLSEIGVALAREVQVQQDYPNSRVRVPVF